MQIQENISLKPYNTFGMEVQARYFARAASADQVAWAVRWVREHACPLMPLSGGSNLLLLEDLDALVLHMDSRGIEVLDRQGDCTLVRAAGGEVWHDFVRWAVEHRLGGVENLAFIPGRVGAAPVQNIGAYGAEARDTIEWVEALDVRTGEQVVLPAEECRFGYRESAFKHEFRGRYIILSVVFRLCDADRYSLKLDYGPIRRALAQQGIASPGLADVARTVEEIRRAKLPDPARIGNSGSFFKNPVVDRATFERLSDRYPDLPSFDPEAPSPQHYKKIPAAWLIERAGWKGYRRGDAGVHTAQALVLVNYGKATGSEILSLCHDICTDVGEKFGVEIRPEVNIVNNASLAALRP